MPLLPPALLLEHAVNATNLSLSEPGRFPTTPITSISMVPVANSLITRLRVPIVRL